MNEQQLAAVKQALEFVKANHSGGPDAFELITALQSIISQDALDKKAENARELGLDYGPHKGLSEHLAQVTNGRVRIDPVTGDVGIGTAPVQEPWKPSDTANRIGGLPQDFIEHKVENEGDWSEWVNPDSEQYFMKCCDCGLVHEMQFKVVKYSEGDECEFIDDADLQAVFRARRATPPAAQKPWVGLTDEEIQTAWDEVMDGAVFTRREIYKAIEAKLKEKNHD
jgi:hypothetical protein